MRADEIPDPLPQLYEELRCWVLDPSNELSTSPRHLGCGVLLRRGMDAWIETCSRLTCALEPFRPTPPRDPVQLPPSAHAQLAATLANALLSHCQGATR